MKHLIIYLSIFSSLIFSSALINAAEATVYTWKGTEGTQDMYLGKNSLTMRDYSESTSVSTSAEAGGAVTSHTTRTPDTDMIYVNGEKAIYMEDHSSRETRKIAPGQKALNPFGGSEGSGMDTSELGASMAALRDQLASVQSEISSNPALSDEQKRAMANMFGAPPESDPQPANKPASRIIETGNQNQVGSWRTKEVRFEIGNDVTLFDLTEAKNVADGQRLVQRVSDMMSLYQEIISESGFGDFVSDSMWPNDFFDYLKKENMVPVRVRELNANGTVTNTQVLEKVVANTQVDNSIFATDYTVKEGFF